jgi:hypothetical protein
MHPMPEGFGCCTTLQFLSFAHNQFAPDSGLPHDLLVLTRLKMLKVAGCGCSHAALDSFEEQIKTAKHALQNVMFERQALV